MRWLALPAKQLRALVGAVDRRMFVWRADGLVPPHRLIGMIDPLWREVSDTGTEFGPPPFARALTEHAEEIAVGLVTAVCERAEPEPGPRFEARLYARVLEQLHEHAARIRAAAADPEMIVVDRPASLQRDEDDPDRRELIVQHRASPLRARFTYGGTYGDQGVVMSKPYSITSIDPDRPEKEQDWGTGWWMYTGLGIGRALYERAVLELPAVRWQDSAVSFYSRGLRVKLHTADPWRWQSKQCTCHKEWASLSADDAVAVEHRPQDSQVNATDGFPGASPDQHRHTERPKG